MRRTRGPPDGAVLGGGAGAPPAADGGRHSYRRDEQPPAATARGPTRAGSRTRSCGPDERTCSLRSGVGGGPSGGVRRLDDLSAGPAGDLRDQAVPAAVLEDQRGALGACEMLIAPAQQGQDDRIELSAGGGEVVLEARRVVAVLPALEDPGGDQRAEPGGQGVPRCSGAPDHLVEAVVAEKDLADGEQRPLLADDLEGAGDGADAGLRWRGHDSSLPLSVRNLDELVRRGYRASRIPTQSGDRPMGLGRISPSSVAGPRSNGGRAPIGGGLGLPGVFARPRPCLVQLGVPLLSP